MRNMVRILAAGALVGCFCGGLANAADNTGPRFILTVPNQPVQAGDTVIATLSMENVQNLGAFQFQVEITGGVVEGIVILENAPDYVLAGQTIAAVDSSNKLAMRAGGVAMGAGKDVVQGIVAEITFKVGKRGSGTIGLVNDVNQTFLRKADATPIASFGVESATFGVSLERPTPAVKKRRSGR